MKIGVTADLHGYLPPIPDDLELLLVAGDVGAFSGKLLESFKGWSSTLTDLYDWVDSAPCPVIACAGNHDFTFEASEHTARLIPWTYLLDQTVECGGFKIHGSPWTPTYGRWAFMQDDEALAAKWELIPNDVDILMTHGPPYGVMDVGHGGKLAGSETLRVRLTQIDPTLHVFGHIHGSRGERWHDTNYLTVNAAYVDEDYQPLSIMVYDL